MLSPQGCFFSKNAARSGDCYLLLISFHPRGEKQLGLTPFYGWSGRSLGGVRGGVGSPGPRRSPSSIPTQCISFKCVFHVSKCIDSHKESVLNAYKLSLVLGEGSNHKSHQDPCPRGAHILQRGKTNSLAKKFINKLISHRGRC